MNDQAQLNRRYASNLLRYVLLPVVFIVLAAALVWFFAFRDTDNQATNSGEKPGSSQTEQGRGQDGQDNPNDRATDDRNADQRGGQTAPAPSDQTPTPDGQAPSNGQTAPGTPGKQGQELAESGPGEVLAVFILVTAAGIAVSHYYHRQKAITK